MQFITSISLSNLQRLGGLGVRYRLANEIAVAKQPTWGQDTRFMQVVCVRLDAATVIRMHPAWSSSSIAPCHFETRARRSSGIP